MEIETINGMKNPPKLLQVRGSELMLRVEVNLPRANKRAIKLNLIELHIGNIPTTNLASTTRIGFSCTGTRKTGTAVYYQ